MKYAPCEENYSTVNFLERIYQGRQRLPLCHVNHSKKGKATPHGHMEYYHSVCWIEGLIRQFNAIFIFIYFFN